MPPRMARGAGKANGAGRGTSDPKMARGAGKANGAGCGTSDPNRDPRLIRRQERRFKKESGIAVMGRGRGRAKGGARGRSASVADASKNGSIGAPLRQESDGESTDDVTVFGEMSGKGADMDKLNRSNANCSFWQTLVEQSLEKINELQTCLDKEMAEKNVARASEGKLKAEVQAWKEKYDGLVQNLNDSPQHWANAAAFAQQRCAEAESVAQLVQSAKMGHAKKGATATATERNGRENATPLGGGASVTAQQQQQASRRASFGGREAMTSSGRPPPAQQNHLHPGKTRPIPSRATSEELNGTTTHSGKPIPSRAASEERNGTPTYSAKPISSRAASVERNGTTHSGKPIPSAVQSRIASEERNGTTHSGKPIPSAVPSRTASEERNGTTHSGKPIPSAVPFRTASEERNGTAHSGKAIPSPSPSRAASEERNGTTPPSAKPPPPPPLPYEAANCGSATKSRFEDAVDNIGTDGKLDDDEDDIVDIEGGIGADIVDVGGGIGQTTSEDDDYSGKLATPPSGEHQPPAPAPSPPPPEFATLIIYENKAQALEVVEQDFLQWLNASIRRPTGEEMKRHRSRKKAQESLDPRKSPKTWDGITGRQILDRFCTDRARPVHRGPKVEMITELFQAVLRIPFMHTGHNQEKTWILVGTDCVNVDHLPDFAPRDYRPKRPRCDATAEFGRPLRPGCFSDSDLGERDRSFKRAVLPRHPSSDP